MRTMPGIRRSFVAKASLTDVVSFFKDLRNLAQCFPGLQEFKDLGGGASYWRVKIELPMATRTVELKATLNEFNDLGASFGLEGINENVRGSGRATFSKEEGGTAVSFEMTLEAGGVMAPFVNQLIGLAMPKLYEEVVRNIIAALEGGKRGTG